MGQSVVVGNPFGATIDFNDLGNDALAVEHTQTATGLITSTTATTYQTIATLTIPANSLKKGIVKIMGFVCAREWDGLKVKLQLGGVDIPNSENDYGSYGAPGASIYISGMTRGNASGLTTTTDNIITLLASKTNADNRDAYGNISIEGY